MKRSKFSLSNYKLLSGDMGELLPIGLTEVLPGDSIQQATTVLLRTMPLMAPVMHPVHVRVHHWFVPHRLVWNDWENFITGGPDGLNASTFPTIAAPASTGFAVGSLADYLGVPPGVADIPVSALPFRGYALIFNEWYRDQDLVSSLTVDLTDGVDTTTNTALQNIAWEKDYFTSARTFEQKGPSITIPLGTDAPVKGIGALDGLTVSDTDRTVRESIAPEGTTIYSRNLASNNSSIYFDILGNGANTDATTGLNIRADLTAASAITVNALREALSLQRFEEARARYGSRYTEYLRYLGVRSSDARLQRPEYLGGGKQTIQFSEVLQTAPEGTEDPETFVGEMRGHGISSVRSNRYRRFFEEHGYVFTLLSVRPKTMYVQGLFRHWNRRSKEDFWQKELEHIGQQEIQNKELYAAHASPDARFGWQDRYDEYRRTESSVAGEFRDSTLNFWHLAREFGTTPALNGDFVKCVPTERIFPVDTQDVLYIMARHSIQARRLVAQTGTSFIY